MSASDSKVSPKLVGLCKWKNIKKVNEMLDNGESPNKISSWINKNGYKISTPMVYEYARRRKQAIMEGINVEHVLSAVNKPIVDRNEPSTKRAVNKLKSELSALDRLIEGGYETLQAWEGPISPRIMMEAIALKNKLTDGNHGFLTAYGMENLRAIEQEKYNLIIEHLLKFIPEEKRDEAIKTMMTVEDEYYQTTEYYEDYLKTQDLSEDEFKKRLDDWKLKNS